MKKTKKYLLLFSIILVIGIVCFNSFSFAKYIANSAWDYYLKSKGFYFYSDFLSSNGIKNVDNHWDGESVHFSIKNNLNQTVVTNYNISYTIECSVKGDAKDYTACYLNGTNLSTYNGILTSFEGCTNFTNDQVDVSSFNEDACESSGYEWTYQPVINDFYFDVIVTDNEYELSDVTVNIKVTSTSPYRKVLSGDFVLHKKDSEENNVTMNYENYDNYDRLIISNSYSKNRCVTISWDPNKLLIDEDASTFISYETDADGYIEEVKFDIEPKTTLSYIFYKRDNSINYGVNDFTIEDTDTCQGK